MVKCLPSRIVLVALLLPAWAMFSCAAADRPVAPASAATSGEPVLFLYDMGSDVSPVWEGFTRVTPASLYSPKAGFGWVDPPKDIQAKTAALLDALAVDHVSVSGGGTLTFRQDVPDGRYDVWVLSGSHLDLQYLMTPHRLLLQGESVQEIDPPPGQVFRAAWYDWSKGDDPFDQFIRPRFSWIHGAVTVTGGKLDIGFAPSSAFPVCAVVVAQSGLASRVQEEIDRLDVRRKAAFHGIWNIAPVGAVEYEAQDPRETSRGYIVSPVSVLSDLLPASQPPPGPRQTGIEVFSTPGEQAQASFAVYALTDLRQVDFSVSELVSEDGRTIPASAIERGLVQFAPRRLGASHGEASADIGTVLVLPARPTTVGTGTCKRFWLTVRPPAVAAPGNYAGIILVTSPGARPATLDLRLRVLPFTLPVPPKEHYLYFGSMIYHARRLMAPFNEQAYWESVRAETRHLRANEFSIATCVPAFRDRFTKKDGRLVDVNLEDTARLMQIVREEDALPRDGRMVCVTLPQFLNREAGGYRMTPEGGRERGLKFAPTPEGRADFIRGVGIIQEKALRAGWPAFVFECSGELSNFREYGTEFGLEVGKAFKDAGVLTALRGNGPSDLEVMKAGLVDFPQPNPAMMQKVWLDFMKATGKGLWAYNSSTGRFGYGWFCFKHGITRMSYEAGVYFAGAPGDIFDDYYRDFPFGGLPLSLTSLAPSMRLKWAVEGAIDYKYLFLLDGLIREGRASTNPVARTRADEARAWLEARLATLPDAVDASRDNPEWYGEVRPGPGWSDDDYDRYRWQAATFIMAIREAL